MKHYESARELLSTVRSQNSHFSVVHSCRLLSSLEIHKLLQTIKSTYKMSVDPTQLNAEMSVDKSDGMFSSNITIDIMYYLIISLFIHKKIFEM